MTGPVTTHTCLACGYSGPEVQMTIVEVPPAEVRDVDVGIAVSWDRLGRVLGFNYLRVPERWAPEPRCRDHKDPKGACAARIRAMSAPPPAAGHGDPAVDEEGPAWLRSS